MIAKMTVKEFEEVFDTALHNNEEQMREQSNEEVFPLMEVLKNSLVYKRFANQLVVGCLFQAMTLHRRPPTPTEVGILFFTTALEVGREIGLREAAKNLEGNF